MSNSIYIPDMIKYTTLGTNDLKRAGRFYDALFAELGATRAIDMERMIGWSVGDGAPIFGVIKPYDGEPSSSGNGGMVALDIREPEIVDALHAKALTLGGTSEGDPGLRFGTFYAGYFRDLDGNKVALVRM